MIKNLILGFVLLFTIMNESQAVGPLKQHIIKQSNDLLETKNQLKERIVRIANKIESERHPVDGPNMYDFIKFLDLQKQIVGIDKQYAKLANIKQSIEDSTGMVAFAYLGNFKDSISQIDFLRQARDQQKIAHDYGWAFKAQCSATELDKHYPVNFDEAIIHLASDLEYLKAGIAK